MDSSKDRDDVLESDRRDEDSWIVEGIEAVDGATDNATLAELQPPWDVPDTVAVTADLGHFCDIEQTIEEGKRCLEAGASALHVHVADGKGGFSADPEIWEQVVSAFRDVDPDVMIDAGPHGDSFEERAQLFREGVYDVVTVLPNMTPDYGRKLITLMDETDVVPGFRTTAGSITRAADNYDDRIRSDDPVLWICGSGNPYWHEPMPDPFAMANGLAQRIRAVRAVDPDGRITVIGGGRESTFLTTQALLFGCDVRGGVGETSFRYPHSNEGLENTNQMVEDMVSAAESIGRRPLEPAEYRAELGLSTA